MPQSYTAKPFRFIRSNRDATAYIAGYIKTYKILPGYTLRFAKYLFKQTAFAGNQNMKKKLLRVLKITGIFLGAIVSLMLLLPLMFPNFAAQ